MNARILILGTVITTIAASTFAADALLSPRAHDTQIKVVSASAPAPVVTVAYVNAATPVSLRAQAAQIKVVKGVVIDKNPAAECRSNMMGTPKAVTACSQSVTMPACQKLAARN